MRCFGESACRPGMKVLRKPSLKSCVVSVAVHTSRSLARVSGVMVAEFMGIQSFPEAAYYNRRLMSDGERMTSNGGSFDYVIVGAGSAGCLLANRLSADPKNSVLLLEAGGKDDYFWIDIPVGYLYTIGNPRTDWCFKTEPDPGLNGRALGYARGKVLGGCSSINAMIYIRATRRLRPLGGLGQPRLVLGRSTAVLQTHRGLRPWRR